MALNSIPAGSELANLHYLSLPPATATHLRPLDTKNRAAPLAPIISWWSRGLRINDLPGPGDQKPNIIQSLNVYFYVTADHESKA